MEIVGADRIVGPGADQIAEYVLHVAENFDEYSSYPDDPAVYAQPHDVIEAGAQVWLRLQRFPRPTIIVRAVEYYHDDLGLF